MTDDPLKRPLVFGDKEQIQAIRFEEVRSEFKALPVCIPCDGTGEHECDCPNCDGDCEDCGGTGREVAAYEAFRARHPRPGFMVSELKNGR